MQDKIDEIMGLVDALSVECIAFGIGKMASSAETKAIIGDEVKKSRALLESKLRELVREPLSHEEACEIIAECEQDGPPYILRNTELAHGITNTSEKQQEVRLTEQQSMEYSKKHGIGLHRGEILILKGKSAQEWLLLGGTNTSEEV